MIRALPLAFAAFAMLFAAPAGLTRAASPGGEATFHYDVIHPTHGQIGTYTNEVREAADEIAVNTWIDIEVKITFITVHRLEAERFETWADGRLVRYAGTTRRNGDTTRVEGRAEGDSFIIEGADGQYTAPPSVMPTNAWSERILGADVVMASETGRLYEASVSGGGRETIEVAGQQISTRHYRMEADTVYDLWFDDSNRIVQFTTVTDGDRVSFLLA